MLVSDEQYRRVVRLANRQPLAHAVRVRALADEAVLTEADASRETRGRGGSILEEADQQQ